MRPNYWIGRILASLVLLGQFGALPFAHRPEVASSQIDLVGPAGSVKFGEKVDILPNGNLLIWDEHFNGNRGAVYLYNGATRALISQLTGSNPGDLVGGDGSNPVNIVFLSDTAGLILSPMWANQAGAVTWFDFTTGANGPVSAANSLVGSQANDQIGSGGVTQLGNGNYLVASPNWANGGNAAAGAVTWASASPGIHAAVGAANSLVGSQANDQVGSGGVTDLGNGKYVVDSPNWANGGNAAAGAVTWADGTIGIQGAVGAANSLVGSQANDQVGGNSVTVLFSGNYVVASPNWANGGNAAAGAATWADGTTGITGAVSQFNSLIGSQANDQVSGNNVTALSNGHYVVVSPNWANGAAIQAGAVTWVDGLSGLAGVVTTTDSLVGNLVGDQVGSAGITELINGNYVVVSPLWRSNNVPNNGFGAVTWASGTSNTAGVVGAANSLVGDQIGDQVGLNGMGLNGIKSLFNGNYLVDSPKWRSGGAAGQGFGAVTWGNGAAGVAGVVSGANSLVGNQIGDQVGSDSINLLGGCCAASTQRPAGSAGHGHGTNTRGHSTNGSPGVVTSTDSLAGDETGGQVRVPSVNIDNYLVDSPEWRSGGTAGQGFGAVTWGNGATGTSGVVSSANSLVGDQTGDQVGHNSSGSFNSIFFFQNGNYMVYSTEWRSGGTAGQGFGALTWGSGTSSTTGVVSSANSLVGGHAGDQLGVGATSDEHIAELSNGKVVIASPHWTNGGAPNAGAAIFANTAGPVTGLVSSANSLVGTHANDQVSSNGVEALDNNPNFAYVVLSPHWTNGGVANAGAATRASGLTGITGAVSAANSLVGDQANDQVGSQELALTSRYYMVSSPNWHGNRGAATWGSGATGVAGVLSSANSLVGSQAGDQVSSGGIVANAESIPDSFVVASPLWANGGNSAAGAVTWGNGATGITGPVSPANSFVGSHTGDQIGSIEGENVTNSNSAFLFVSPHWANSGNANAGAVTVLPGYGPSSGLLSVSNSVRGSTAGGGSVLNWQFDCVNAQLVVGRPADNTVTLFKGVVACLTHSLYLPLIQR